LTKNMRDCGFCFENDGQDFLGKWQDFYRFWIRGQNGPKSLKKECDQKVNLQIKSTRKFSQIGHVTKTRTCGVGHFLLCFVIFKWQLVF